MLARMDELIVWFDDLVWGLPLIVFILITGIYLTVRLNLLQLFHLPRALMFMVKNEESGRGEVTSFGALCTAMSATIGTGAGRALLLHRARHGQAVALACKAFCLFWHGRRPVRYRYLYAGQRHLIGG